jgi:ABC-type transport system involved in multi-copper enzyme maturation permease subunit
MIRRSFWIAANTVFEMFKDRTVTGFLAVGVIFILGGYVIADMSFVEKKKMFLDVGMGAIFIVSAFVTLLAGSNVIDREIRDKQVLCTLSKPLPRSAWVAGKTAGFLFTLAAIIFSLTFFLFIYIRLMTGLWIPVVFLGGFLIFLEMVLLSSYTLLFSTITSQYLTLFFAMMVLITGHMIDDLKIYWASHSIAARVVSRIFWLVLPDLDTFLAAPAISGAHPISINLLFNMLLYTTGYLLIAVILSILTINKKEMV